MLAWLQLNRELLTITGDARYAEEIERTAYNDLLGAFAPNGEDWCYYSFPNGKRVRTTYWRCCKSSGAMALEELSAIAYARSGNDLCVNLLGPGTRRSRSSPRAASGWSRSRTIRSMDSIQLRIDPERPASFGVRIRIPSWAGTQSTQRINGASIPGVGAGEFLTLNREWRAGDELTLDYSHAAADSSARQSERPGIASAGRLADRSGSHAL